MAERLSLDTALTLKEAMLQRRPEDGGAMAVPPLTLIQHLTLDLGNAIVQLAEGRLDFSGLQAHFGGAVHHVTTTPQLDLQLTTNAFAPGELLSLFPILAATLPEPVDLRGHLQLRGSLKGALVGSLMVGLLDNFGKALFPELSYFTLFAPMAAILAVRPTGLFGRA